MNDTFDDLQAALDAYKAHQRRAPKSYARIDRWWAWWLREGALRRQLMQMCALLFMCLQDLDEDEDEDEEDDRR